MKVILLETIEELGSVGQEVKVKDGYARNYLIPGGKAVPATKGAAKTFKDKIDADIKAEAKTRGHAQKAAEELSAVALSFKVKSGDDGKLFGSITTSQVSNALKDKGFEIEKKKIHLTEPIKHTGTHDVSIRLYPGVTAVIKVEVKSEV
jgi:large subunit ribosomal protein L9